TSWSASACRRWTTCRSWPRSFPITSTTNRTRGMSPPGRDPKGGGPASRPARPAAGPARPAPPRASRPDAVAPEPRALAAAAARGVVGGGGGGGLGEVGAAGGVGRRGHGEELIGEGGVEVDGVIVRRYGARVDPERQIIRVDGRRIAASEKLVYVARNKPAGV